MAIQKVGKASVGEVTAVDSTQRNPLGMIVPGPNGEEFIYLKGIGSTAEGSWVTYDEEGVTTLLAANAKGPVAVAMAAIVASSYGWYCILAPMGVDAKVVTATSADTLVGRETTDGCVGDGRATGDQIYGVICREANASGSTALRTCQIWMHPFVDDAYGS